MGKQWKQCQTLFLGAPKITGDGDCSHEIERCLLLGRKVMTYLDSILKSRDITLPILAKALSILFIFSKNQLLVSLLFAIVSFVSIILFCMCSSISVEHFVGLLSCYPATSSILIALKNSSFSMNTFPISAHFSSKNISSI